MINKRNNKTICIINTGGTIGMKYSEQGLIPVNGFLVEQLKNLSELNHSEMPSYHIIEYDPLIDSANATSQFWLRIAESIVEHYDQYDGFVILHGTDSMAYTASALSFILENLSKPVILTGSQVPLAKIPSDARRNVIDALYVASHYDINEVCIFFSDKLYRGNRTTKNSSLSYNAFNSPNYPVLGKVSSAIKINDELLLAKPSGDFSFCKIDPIHIGVVRLFPGFSEAFLQNVLQKPLQGLIIQSYGTGNAPANNKALINVLEKATQHGVVIVNCSQCPHGRVTMQNYATGHSLAQAGLVSAIDMTIEATIAKLYYLFHRYSSHDEIKRQLQIDLRGEISP